MNIFPIHCAQTYFRYIAAKRIQSRFRGNNIRGCFGALHAAATMLQGVVRGARARVALDVVHSAATSVQSLYRGHRARRRTCLDAADDDSDEGEDDEDGKK